MANPGASSFSLDDVPGVTTASASNLRRHGVTTVRQLADAEPTFLRAALGPRARVHSMRGAAAELLYRTMPRESALPEWIRVLSVPVAAGLLALGGTVSTNLVTSSLKTQELTLKTVETMNKVVESVLAGSSADSVRSARIRMLPLYGKAAVPTLLVLLNSTDPKVRDDAEMALLVYPLMEAEDRSAACDGVKRMRKIPAAQREPDNPRLDRIKGELCR